MSSSLFVMMLNTSNILDVNIFNTIACGCCGRFHKAAGDATKQAAKLQAEAKAAAAQSDAASATAEDAKGLARRLDMKTGHLRRNTSTAAGQVLLLTCLAVGICFHVSGNVPLEAMAAFPLRCLLCGAVPGVAVPGVVQPS